MASSKPGSWPSPRPRPNRAARTSASTARPRSNRFLGTLAPPGAATAIASPCSSACARILLVSPGSKSSGFPTDWTPARQRPSPKAWRLLPTARRQCRSLAPQSGAMGGALSAAAIDKGGIRVTGLSALRRNRPHHHLARGRPGNGRSLVEQPLDFGLTDLKREAVLNLPLELRNELARIEIAAEHDAGAVRLVDDRWRRKAVGIATGSSLEPRAALALAALLCHPRP